ncbi:hypothetical protein CXG81DRAFT_16466 [Caulochytrium protostelioides]|uniref:Zinc finger PHD-type domain-containing protein n=1 Tax=Caulochytrium protostelioides TaxID=1555241 RepID=A0A4V1IVH1_9FUNG|nr:hypothetical protein CXG81DRAFT_16466 [Caulochytrium protostelioides]|eukprot:RKP04039.1 hypothetical protein CXG81DRAFT_16466 [Caulochytrium protostelioides]
MRRAQSPVPMQAEDVGSEADDDDGTAEPDDGIIRCVCGSDQDDGYTIQCEKCLVWQHMACVNVGRRSVPDIYFCDLCRDPTGATGPLLPPIDGQAPLAAAAAAEAARDGASTPAPAQSGGGGGGGGSTSGVGSPHLAGASRSLTSSRSGKSHHGSKKRAHASTATAAATKRQRETDSSAADRHVDGGSLSGTAGGGAAATDSSSHGRPLAELSPSTAAKSKRHPSHARAGGLGGSRLPSSPIRRKKDEEILAEAFRLASKFYVHTDDGHVRVAEPYPRLSVPHGGALRSEPLPLGNATQTDKDYVIKAFLKKGVDEDQRPTHVYEAQYRAHANRYRTAAVAWFYADAQQQQDPASGPRPGLLRHVATPLSATECLVPPLAKLYPHLPHLVYHGPQHALYRDGSSPLPPLIVIPQAAIASRPGGPVVTRLPQSHRTDVVKYGVFAVEAAAVGDFLITIAGPICAFLPNFPEDRDADDAATTTTSAKSPPRPLSAAAVSSAAVAAAAAATRSDDGSFSDIVDPEADDDAVSLSITWDSDADRTSATRSPAPATPGHARHHRPPRHHASHRPHHRRHRRPPDASTARASRARDDDETLMADGAALTPDATSDHEDEFCVFPPFCFPHSLSLATLGWTTPGLPPEPPPSAGPELVFWTDAREYAERDGRYVRWSCGLRAPNCELRTLLVLDGPAAAPAQIALGLFAVAPIGPGDELVLRCPFPHYYGYPCRCYPPTLGPYGDVHPLPEDEALLAAVEAAAASATPHADPDGRAQDPATACCHVRAMLQRRDDVFVSPRLKTHWLKPVWVALPDVPAVEPAPGSAAASPAVPAASELRTPDVAAGRARAAPPADVHADPFTLSPRPTPGAAAAAAAAAAARTSHPMFPALSSTGLLTDLPSGSFGSLPTGSSLFSAAGGAGTAPSPGAPPSGSTAAPAPAPAAPQPADPPRVKLSLADFMSKRTQSANSTPRSTPHAAPAQPATPTAAIPAVDGLLGRAATTTAPSTSTATVASPRPFE